MPNFLHGKNPSLDISKDKQLILPIYHLKEVRKEHNNIWNIMMKEEEELRRKYCIRQFDYKYYVGIE